LLNLHNSSHLLSPHHKWAHLLLIFWSEVMRKTLSKMLTSTESNDASVIFLWKIAYVIPAVIWWWNYLRHLCLDDVIMLLYSLYAFITLPFDILHLLSQYMCEKWIIAHICYVIGFASKTGRDTMQSQIYDSNLDCVASVFDWASNAPMTLDSVVVSIVARQMLSVSPGSFYDTNCWVLPRADNGL
jgi:hypothetical protein